MGRPSYSRNRPVRRSGLYEFLAALRRQRMQFLIHATRRTDRREKEAPDASSEEPAVPEGADEGERVA